MAGRGDDSLSDKHYDADILLAYALDQLPPDQAAQVGAHVATCSACKATVSEAQHLTRHIDRALHDSLDSAQPGPRLRFDPISHAWHRPPRRVTYPHRLKRLTSGFIVLPLLMLLTLAITLLVSFEDSFARHNLQLARNYSGPPALVAVALDGSIAKVVGLSAPAVGERVRKLEQAGVIRGFRAVLDPEALGLHVTAFVMIAPQPRTPARDLVARLEALPEVEALYAVAGVYSFMAKVRARSTAELDEFLDRLFMLEGVERTETTMVLRTVAERAIPLPFA